ncbi:hypothetical protein PCO82_06550 [Pectobacteriaceae bacterium CE90]|nr:hypothetical protein PCO82_06550 [Pectobacteriaceae bacterium CE90]
MKIYPLMLLMSLFSGDALAKNDSNTYRQLLQDFLVQSRHCVWEKERGR